MKNTNLLALATLALLAACQPSIDTVAPNGAQLDFTKYVAVGNSLTAGYADGGLDYYRQTNSYPNMLAQQMKLIDGSIVFNQPYFAQSGNGSGYAFLKSLSAAGTPVLDTADTDANEVEGVVNTQGSGPKPNFRDVANGLQMNNLGVPGIRLSDITIPGYGFANPLDYNQYFERLLPLGAGKFTTYQQVINQSKPTFFTCWLGNNDVLGYATAGAASSSLTPVNTFTDLYGQVIDTLTKGGVEGLVSTIPYVSSTPFFTTIPYNVLTLTEDNATKLNALARSQGYFFGIKTLNFTRPADDQLDTTGFVAGQNPPLVEDKQLPPGPLAMTGRKLRSDEYLLLTLPTSELASGLGTARPIPDRYVLTRAEIKEIRERTDAYNAAIRAKAESKGLAIFESGALLQTLAQASGIPFDGITVKSSFLSGGAFGLDGVHPTPRGYAIVANGMIQAINKKYGSSIPEVNINAYAGVKFPL